MSISGKTSLGEGYGANAVLNRAEELRRLVPARYLTRG